MVVVLMGLLDEINEAKRKSDLAARLSVSSGPARSGNKRPTNAGTGYVHNTWHGTAKSSTSAPGKGVHPLLKSNLTESGCPQTAPQYARGTGYAQRLGRTQATALYQRTHAVTGQAEQLMYNPNNPQMARLQMAHVNMGYPMGYQSPAPTMYQPQVQPILAQGQPVQQQQQMQQPVYTPPQSFVHPDNTTPAQQPASTAAQPTLIPTPVETPAQPVSTGTVETPPEVEPVPGSGGFFWTFSLLMFLGSIAAIIWYYYQKVYGKRHSRRAPRRWETIRAKVMQTHYVQDQLRSNGDLEGGYPGRVARQHSVDNQVPLCSRHPSLLERVSKGSKLG